MSQSMKVNTSARNVVSRLFCRKIVLMQFRRYCIVQIYAKICAYGVKMTLLLICLVGCAVHKLTLYNAVPLLAQILDSQVQLLQFFILCYSLSWTQNSTRIEIKMLYKSVFGGKVQLF